MDRSLMIGGERCWVHKDPMIDCGFFHSYDSLSVPGHEKHKVHIFLPKDYDTAEQSYPVVYMNDGHCVFWAEGLGGASWQVHHTLQELYRTDKIKKLIIVAIIPNDRNKEYTHVYWAFEGYRPVWDALPGSSWGGLKHYAQYVVGVKEFVDRNYRTESDASQTSIIGASHGGLASFYIALAHPTHFGIAGCMSASFGAGLDFGGSGGFLKDAPLVQDLKHNLMNKIRPRFWFGWGLKRDGGPHNSIVEQVATDRSKELQYLLIDSYHYQQNKDITIFEDTIGGHEETAWKYHFRLFVTEYYSK
eukprot:TRINITY_DN12595_c0_g1_i2.p1 TRINITY_DN12595_c0_g1~~TRINITY_DN12595_c0_g1_i2.p1  ORF type:complete len:303 (+),score=53.74 TRINITY_DN12595_c0_g1_i2:69-977(+)